MSTRLSERVPTLEMKEKGLMSKCAFLRKKKKKIIEKNAINYFSSQIKISYEDSSLALNPVAKIVLCNSTIVLISLFDRFRFIS